MREGRRRPSLFSEHQGIRCPPHAAMREGRRRPSLDATAPRPPEAPRRRNEGGAPAPLVGRF